LFFFFLVVKAELQKKYLEVQQPAFLSGLEKIVKQNNGGDGFAVGDSVCLSFLCIQSNTIAFHDTQAFLHWVISFSSSPPISLGGEMTTDQ
jgi:hypothetical protein